MQQNTRTLANLACEECRRRKARCDRVRPQCGTCAEVGYVCVVNEKRPQRGPKKGQMNALRSRVGSYRQEVAKMLRLTIGSHIGTPVECSKYRDPS